jgi:hypothetical protein
MNECECCPDSDSFSEGLEIEYEEYTEGVLKVTSQVIFPDREYSGIKSLLCYSTIHNTACRYGDKCTYAHGMEHQNIDACKRYSYQIMLDKELMNFYSVSNPNMHEIYSQLIFQSGICRKCSRNKCAGGLNCKYGANNKCVEICRNDLLTGCCNNKITNIEVPSYIINKIPDIVTPDIYEGCQAGHHLTLRGLVPYYKYIHNREYMEKTKYETIKHINVDAINQLHSDYGDSITSSSDSEVMGWFRDAKREMDESGSSDSSDSLEQNDINEKMNK